MLMKMGEIDGTPYTMLTTLRLFPSDDKVALCGATRVLSSHDISARLREGMELSQSTLTLTRKADTARMVVSPRFIPVTYQAWGDNGKSGIKLSDLGSQQAGCVVTMTPWQDQWGKNQFSPSLSLFVRDTRKRQQTVVGDDGAVQ